jgi:hypothetical protein
MLENHALHLWRSTFIQMWIWGYASGLVQAQPQFHQNKNYVERLKFEFNLEIQSEHFGNCWSLSIEGCSCQFMKEGQLLMKMHSHFSDPSRQDARTTYAHMKVEL